MCRLPQQKKMVLCETKLTRTYESAVMKVLQNAVHLVILKAGLSLCLMSVHGCPLLLLPPPLRQAYLPLFYTEQSGSVPVLRSKQDEYEETGKVFVCAVEKKTLKSFVVWFIKSKGLTIFL